MKKLLPLLNPIEWLKAFSFHKKNSKYKKSSYDLELYLYSKMLKNDMLHYGYFEDININPENISIKQLEMAQILYAENIIEYISNRQDPVLDVGCGLGGLSNLIMKNNIEVEALTPNKNQIHHIQNKFKNLTLHNLKFENYKTTKKYGTIINSESLQYIKLHEAFSKANKLILPNGRWIIIDYFRLNKDGVNKSSHLLEDFHEKVREYGWKIKYEKDITNNILPTNRFINMYAERFLIPIQHYAFEKLRYKKAWLYYLTKNIRTFITKKIDKELSAINPDKFINEKKYLFFVLEKQ